MELLAFQNLIDEHNKQVDDFCAELLSIDEGEYTTTYVKNLIHNDLNQYHLPTNPESDEYRDVRYSDLAAKSQAQLNAMRLNGNKTRNKIFQYIDVCDENRESLLKMIEKGMPIFLVVEPLKIDYTPFDIKDLVWWGDKGSYSELSWINLSHYAKKKYCFCYEFKKTDNKWEYLANVVDTNFNSAYNTTIDLRYASVRAMTEEEFENEYIINRVGLMHNMSESDIVKYDNEIRQLFHGQREII